LCFGGENRQRGSSATALLNCNNNSNSHSKTQTFLAAKMSNPPLFKDFGKRFNDLLTKEFPTQDQKVEWKGTTSGGVSLETNLTKSGEAITGTFTPKYKFKDWKTTVTVEANTKRDGKIQAEIEDLTPNLKTTVSVQRKGTENFLGLNTEYRHPSFALTGAADYGKAKGSLFEGSFVFGYQAFAVGLRGSYLLGKNPDDSDLKDLTVKGSYTTTDGDFVVSSSLTGGDKGDKTEVEASYYHKVSSELQVGSSLKADTSSTSVKPVLSLGTQYNIGGDKDSTIKAKASTNGDISLAFHQRYNRNVKFGFGWLFDTNQKNSSFGFTLSLSD